MGSYTPNLNLLMKDPVADGADTFNISTMLNDNWDKIDRQVLRAMAAAAAYDAGATYQKGDFCTQGGLLYRANQAIAQPEAWTAGNWTAISVTDVIRGLTAADVGAAPAGYGLGDTHGANIPDGDANNAIYNGWYGVVGTESNLPTSADGVQSTGGAILFVHTRREDLVKYQILYLGTAGQQGYSLRRFYHNAASTWYPWEWINPRMALGVEYRTTERYNSKPVYKKAINFGAAPNATSKTVAHGISDFSQLVSYSGMLGGGNLIGTPNVSSVYINATSITIRTNTDVSVSYIYVILSYTKTTD